MYADTLRLYFLGSIRILNKNLDFNKKISEI